MDTIEFITTTVCHHTNIPVNTMRIKTRKHEIVLARQLICYFAKKLTKLSGRKIGLEVGGISQSDVQHSKKTIQGYIDTNYEPDGFMRIFLLCKHDIMNHFKAKANGSSISEYEQMIDNELLYYLTLK